MNFIILFFTLFSSSNNWLYNLRDTILDAYCIISFNPQNYNL